MRWADLRRTTDLQRRQARERGILLATGGYLLALLSLLVLRTLGIAHFSTAGWLKALAGTLAAQAALWGILRLGWDVRLTWDRHYIYTPMVVAVFLLNGYVYMAPEGRFILMMAWFAALFYTAGYAGLLSVLVLSLLYTAGYFTVVLGLTDSTRIGSLESEVSTGTAFFLVTAYAALVLEGIRRDRQAMRQFQRLLLETSVTDPMTGLYNYREFYRRLEQELRRAERYGHPFALLVVDIDRLKAINDLYGHLLGDELIRHVARIVQDNIRPSDSAYRYGGDEFFVILPETSAEGAKVLAERLSYLVAASSFPVAPDQTIRPTVSIGLATYPDQGRTVQELVSAADRALYTAKRARYLDSDPLGFYGPG